MFTSPTKSCCLCFSYAVGSSVVYAAIRNESATISCDSLDLSSNTPLPGEPIIPPTVCNNIIACLSLTPPDTHALLMTSQDPYSDTDTVELDPGLGPIKINSTVFNHEYILVQRLQETNPVPLWVSVYRRPFRQTVFLLDEPLQHAVSPTSLHSSNIYQCMKII